MIRGNPIKTTSCPACLFILHEIGRTPEEQAARLGPDGILWCAHHRRVFAELIAQVGQLYASGMVARLETFAKRFYYPGRRWLPGHEGGR